MATTMGDALREVANTDCPARLLVDVYGVNVIKGILTAPLVGDKVVMVSTKYEYTDEGWWADSTQAPTFVAVDKIVTLTYAEED
jgi:hypothetical protein